MTTTTKPSATRSGRREAQDGGLQHDLPYCTTHLHTSCSPPGETLRGCGIGGQEEA